MNNLFQKYKTDFLLIGGILLAGCVIGLLLWAFLRPGEIVRVQVSGKVVAEFPLSQDIRYEITGSGGKNLLVIQNGEAWVQEADCPDKLCVKTGHIRYGGQSVICLPNQVVVEILSTGRETLSGDVDAVVGR